MTKAKIPPIDRRNVELLAAAIAKANGHSHVEDYSKAVADNFEAFANGEDPADSTEES
jgi:hypothetical protein